MAAVYSGGAWGEATVVQGGVGIVNGKYPGTYPQAITVQDYDAKGSAWTVTDALSFAMRDPAPAAT